MQQRYVSIILAITLVIAIASYLPRGVRGNGDVIEETRTVRNFDEISLHTLGNAIVTVGNETSVRIEGESNIMELIKTDVSNNALNIRSASRRNLNPTRDLTYYITVETLEEVTLTASGNMQVDIITLDNNKLTTTVSASGDLTIESVQADEVDIRSSASGTIIIGNLITENLEVAITASGTVAINNGEVDTQDISITGSGDYNAPQLISRETEIRMTGSGDASVTANEDLSAILTGSSDLFYAGTAEVSRQISGSGNVIKQDF